MKDIKRVYSLAGSVFFCIILCGAMVDTAFAETRPVILHSIHQTQAPQISNKRLVYTAELRFSRAPEHFWVYYDKSTQELVLDVYSDEIKGDTVARTVINNDVFGKIDVFTRSSNVSFGGKQSQVRIVMATGWHYEAKRVDDYAIQLVVWKHLRAPKISKAEKYRPLLYLGSAVVVAAISFLGITFIISPDR